MLISRRVAHCASRRRTWHLTSQQELNRGIGILESRSLHRELLDLIAQLLDCGVPDVVREATRHTVQLVQGDRQPFADRRRASLLGDEEPLRVTYELRVNVLVGCRIAQLCGDVQTALVRKRRATHVWQAARRLQPRNVANHLAQLAEVAEPPVSLEAHLREKVERRAG